MQLQPIPNCNADFQSACSRCLPFGRDWAHSQNSEADKLAYAGYVKLLIADLCRPDMLQYCSSACRSSHRKGFL
jgi:hypothetical protein